MNKPPHIEQLYYWMTERHSIYLKRQHPEIDPREWTQDPIFKRYSFCNVFRELDRVTQWIRLNLREPYADHKNLWFLMCVARQINWPPTLADLLLAGLPDVWDPKRVRAALWERQRNNKKVYTGAYMLRGDIQNDDPTVPNDKPTYTCFKVLDPVFKEYSTRFEDPAEHQHFPQTIQGWTRYLESFHGWGGFLAYEVATDLRHTRYLCNAPDIRTWANPGPGAKRGLNRLWGRPTKQDIPREKAIEEMQALLAWAEKDLPSWVNYAGLSLEMRDIEHSLCEVDKYQRVAQEEGRPRARFKVWNGKW